MIRRVLIFPAVPAPPIHGTKTMLERLLFYLKVSRPGLWFQTLWLYLLPVAGQSKFTAWEFWLGIVYVLFPLNFLVYGWNDFVDRAVDESNPRKDSFLFGARGTEAQLATLPRMIALVNAPFIVAFTFIGGCKMLVVLTTVIFVVAIYNRPNGGLRGTPPFELLNQLGYLLLLPFSVLLNQSSSPPWQSIVYLVLFCTHAHLMGEIMDVHPDRQAGRRTTATVLGIIPVKWIVAGLILVEAFMISVIFHDHVLGGFLLFGVAWLIFDIHYFRDSSYTQNQFLLFGLGLNAAGFGSMAWIWFTGTLTRLP